MTAKPPYWKLYQAIVRRGDLNPTDKIVYSFIRDGMRNGNTWRVGVRKIAEQCVISKGAASRAVTNLLGAGVLVARRGGGRSVTVYKLPAHDRLRPDNDPQDGALRPTSGTQDADLRPDNDPVAPHWRAPASHQWGATVPPVGRIQTRPSLPDSKPTPPTPPPVCASGSGGGVINKSPEEEAEIIRRLEAAGVTAHKARELAADPAVTAGAVRHAAAERLRCDRNPGWLVKELSDPGRLAPHVEAQPPPDHPVSDAARLRQERAMEEAAYRADRAAGLRAWRRLSPADRSKALETALRGPWAQSVAPARWWKHSSWAPLVANATRRLGEIAATPGAGPLFQTSGTMEDR